eukprot:bmy_17501T0
MKILEGLAKVNKAVPVPSSPGMKRLGEMRKREPEKHFIFGEPRELITKEFVKEKYLEYRQVSNTDPAQFEFLWGPRAHAETTKMKVLEFLSKVHGTDPSSFPSQYEDALQDEEERARARISARAPLLPWLLQVLVSRVAASSSPRTSYVLDRLFSKPSLNSCSSESAALLKYKMKKPIMEAHMLMNFNKKNEDRSPEIRFSE